MDLELTEELPTEVVGVSELLPQDLEIHKGEAVQVAELRSVHHKIAMLLAGGAHTKVEIARHVGMSPRTIKQLEGNPAFQDLQAHYEQRFRERLEETITRLEDRVELTTHELLDEFQGQVRDPNVVIPFPVLADSTFKMLDRAGIGPVKRVEQRSVSLRFTGERMAQIREEAERVVFHPQAANNGVRPEEILPEGGGSDLGETVPQRTVGEDPADWKPREGKGS